MKIKYNTIMDIFFIIFIFSSMVFPKNLIGKVGQLLLIIGVIFLIKLKKTKFTKINFLELIFSIYVFLQVILNIAQYKNATLSMGITIFYNFVFSVALLNYFIYRKDLKKISYIYAITTIFSFLILAIFFSNSILSFRFNCTTPYYLFGTLRIGGHSSTSLSMFAVIPCFFINLFYESKNKNRNLIISLVLLLFSILTGTRKTLIIFAFIFIFMIPLKGKNINFSRLIKISLAIIFVGIPIFISVFKIPTLYNIIGYRIESALTYFQSESSINQIEDDSIRVRKRMIAQSINLYKERKFFGWGMDYFKASEQNDLGYYSHNNFLELLTGGGLVGFIIYYSKYLIIFFELISCYKKASSKHIWFMNIIFLSLMTLLEYWQVTYIYRFIIIYQVFQIAIIYQYKKGELYNYEKKETNI